MIRAREVNRIPVTILPSKHNTDPEIVGKFADEAYARAKHGRGAFFPMPCESQVKRSSLFDFLRGFFRLAV